MIMPTFFLDRPTFSSAGGHGSRLPCGGFKNLWNARDNSVMPRCISTQQVSMK